MRIPKHIGIIPDGNRRWATSHGLSKDKGYSAGINPGLILFKQCEKFGIEELTFYGFTVDNTKRPSVQKEAFTKACINAVNSLKGENVEILVIGNTNSPCFPKELLCYTKPKKFGTGKTRVNFLINYGWEWDLNSLKTSDKTKKNITKNIQSNDISRIDLIIRWG
ncbi:MAG: dihydroorotate dehydrogenase, partial [Clostridium sp.]|nr:dihydroorotate dehydrogenase [Clostridium sp.]